MNRDDVERMARDAGFNCPDDRSEIWTSKIDRFAALVAAAEREACAKVLADAADRLAPEGNRSNQFDRHMADVLRDKAAAIRARGT